MTYWRGWFQPDLTLLSFPEALVQHAYQRPSFVAKSVRLLWSFSLPTHSQSICWFQHLFRPLQLLAQLFSIYLRLDSWCFQTALKADSCLFLFPLDHKIQFEDITQPLAPLDLFQRAYLKDLSLHFLNSFQSFKLSQRSHSILCENPIIHQIRDSLQQMS